MVEAIFSAETSVDFNQAIRPYILRSWDNSFGTATDWTAGVRFPAAVESCSLLHSIQTGLGAHTTSYPVRIGSKGLMRRKAFLYSLRFQGTDQFLCRVSLNILTYPFNFETNFSLDTIRNIVITNCYACSCSLN
jgi:hypothetical protein